MATNPMGIDFMAIARGRRLGENHNWEDRQRQFADIRNQFERQELEQKMQNMAFNRQAQAYTAPVINNWQRAADAGVSAPDFFIQQREQIMADPAFQSMTPEVQQRVWKALGSSVVAQLQDLQRQGLVADATRLASAYGFGDVTTPLDRAAMSGNPQQITDALRTMYGADLTVNPDGNTVNILGTDVPLDVALPGILQSRQVAGAFPAAATQRMANMQRDDLKNQRDQEYAALGFVQGEDGRWYAPVGNPAVSPTGVQGLGVGANDLIPPVGTPGQLQQMPAGAAADLVNQSMGGGVPAGQPVGVPASPTVTSMSQVSPASVQSAVIQLQAVQSHLQNQIANMPVNDPRRQPLVERLQQINATIETYNSILAQPQ